MHDIWIAMLIGAIAIMVLSMGCGATVPVTSGASTQGEGNTVEDNDTTEVDNDYNSTWLLLGQDIISHTFWLVIALIVIVGLWKGKWSAFGG